MFTMNMTIEPRKITEVWINFLPLEATDCTTSTEISNVIFPGRVFAGSLRVSYRNDGEDRGNMGKLASIFIKYPVSPKRKWPGSWSCERL